MTVPRPLAKCGNSKLYHAVSETNKTSGHTSGVNHDSSKMRERWTKSFSPLPSGTGGVHY